jgi:hypothetical protein
VNSAIGESLSEKDTALIVNAVSSSVLSAELGILMVGGSLTPSTVIIVSLTVFWLVALLISITARVKISCPDV